VAQGNAEATSRTAAGVRGVAKAFGWLLLGLATLVLIWFAVNRLLDAAPSPAQEALSRAIDPLNDDSKNVAVAILGLTAPKGADFIQHGLRVKALYAANAPNADIQNMMRGSQALRPTVEGNQVNCWLDPDWTAFKDCLPFDRAPAVLEENGELLRRYKALYELPRYAAADTYYNDAYFILVRLALAEIHVDLRKGKHESAYRKWQQQFQFAKRNLRGTDTWVGKAIGLVAMGMTLPVLDSLLMTSPNLAKTHAAELTMMLRPEGIAAFDPDGIVRAEFHLLKKALEHRPIQIPGYGVDRIHWLAFHFGQKNRILNRYAVFASEYSAALRLPWIEMETELARMREKHFEPTPQELLLDPFGSLLFAEFIDGQLKGREMVRQMHITDGRLRLATLLVRLLDENVRDHDLPRFLASANRGLFDPFSGTPARWDPKDRKIYFVDPTDKCTVVAWFRVRDANRTRAPLSSVVNQNGC
jgi:hypothetical protein